MAHAAELDLATRSQAPLENFPSSSNIPVRAPETQLPAERQPSVMDIIGRAVTDPNMDVDKLERLIALSERAQAREAEQAFSVAMNKAQAEIRPIAADASNQQTKSKYASYLALDKALRPIYSKHGFSLSFDTADAQHEGDVRVLCHVAHEAGHSRTYRIDMPADGKGAKGGDVMTRTHATGAAMTYGQRYLLKLIFNIAVGDDDDGNAASNDPITPDQVETIRVLISRTNADVEKFCKFFKIEAIPNLKAGDYKRAVATLNLKEKRVQG